LSPAAAVNIKTREKTQIIAFWNLMPRIFLRVDRRFGEIW
jgi:hypothetical protein